MVRRPARAAPITRTPPRVVLDTNVVLSALVFASGGTAALRLAWQQRRCLPLVSTATARELVRVLAHPKFKLDADEQHDLLADYLPYTEVVQVPMPPPAVPDCRDPNDLPFLHLAVAGAAQALVSGDKVLLTLNGQLPFPILSADAWMTELALPGSAGACRRTER